MLRAAGDQRPAVPAWALHLHRVFAAMIDDSGRCWLCGAADCPALAAEAVEAEARGRLQALLVRLPAWAAESLCAWCAETVRP
jgi:hypothetical protein